MRFYTNVQQYKNEFLVRGYENGQRVQYPVRVEPYLFTTDRVSMEEYRTLDGKKVYKKTFESSYEARKWMEENNDVSGKEIYGMTVWTYPFINDHYPEDINYDASLISVVTIDIETSAEGGFPNIQTADKQVTAITIRKNDTSYVFGYYDYKPSSDRIIYTKCKDENELLNKFLTTWSSKEIMPDVVTGWNCEMFDMPYLINRINRILGPESAKRLSPWKIIQEREIEINGKKISIPIIVGITILDYLPLHKKFSFTTHESYKLDYIASVELGEKKLDYHELGYDNLDDFYKGDFQNYIEYNIRDVDLVYKLEDKLKFIEQVFALAYDGKVNYLDTFTTVRMWDIIIHNYLMKDKIVVPTFDVQDRIENDRTIVGAYVKDPIVGMKKWVVSFDLNSLYPHLIMQYNISPETYKTTVASLATSDGVDKILDGALDDPNMRDFLIDNNYTIAASGCCFDRDRQGFLPTLMERVYNDRVKYKKDMIKAKQQYQKTPTYELEKEIARCHNMQMAKKIQLNSAYGALGNMFFRWFDPKYAESITISGQLSIRWMEKNMNEYMNKMVGTTGEDYVIAVDTDSMYINFEKFVDKFYPNHTDEETVKFLDKVCEAKIEKYIDQCYDKLGVYVNAFQQKMKMKREVIANKGIFIAKKRYILNVHNSEGVQYAEPELKMMGIEAVRSSTPGIIRDSIKQTLRIIMNGNEEDVQKYIADEKKVFMTLPYEDVAFPRGCKDMTKWLSYENGKPFKTGTPIHVKGAILYNEQLKRLKLEKKYEPIHDGEKIKFCYLRTPNPTGEHVISTPGILPKELDLNKFIDYEKQFDKAFVEPIKTILDVIGWSVEKRFTLERFFV